MDLKEIQNLIKFVAKSGASEVKLEMEDIKITIKTGSEKTETTVIQQAALHHGHVMQSAPVSAPVAAVAASSEEEEENEESKYLIIKSPIIGTFYRKPSPDKPMFVNVGDTISAGDTVCIIEAMKLFNEIESEISGKIVKILVEECFAG